MIYKYGEFSSDQISDTKKYIRKRIFFLLLIVENKDNQYKDMNVNEAFDIELRKIGGLNKLLFEPPELVRVQMLLEAALIELNSPNYDWQKYRKLILDAGHEIEKVKEV